MQNQESTVQMESNEIKLTRELKDLPIEHLKCSKYNNYPLNDMDEMEGSILSVGLISPLSVIGPDENGDYFYLSGNRRFTAIKNLNERGETHYTQIPCCIIGDINMPVLVQKLIIESANLETREFDKNARRFNVIKILEDMVKDGILRKSQVCRQAAKYMKISRRYRSMYINIFRNGDDELQDLVSEKTDEKNRISVSKANTIASMPMAEQKDVIEKIKNGENANKVITQHKEKKEVKNASTPLKNEETAKDANIENIDEIEDIDTLYDMFNDESDVDMTIDTTGEIKSLQKEDEREYKTFLNRISRWCKKMGRSSTFSNDELVVIEDMRDLIESVNDDVA